MLRRMFVAAGAAAVVVGMVVRVNARADEAAVTVVRVEEDWVLEVGEPDERTSSPQIATQMNPNASNLGIYAVFAINFQEQPDFNEGGMEVRMHSGNTVNSKSGGDFRKLCTTDEIVKWTQYLAVDGEAMKFGVSQGSSYTYGSFGGTMSLTTPTSLRSLDSYQTDLSVAKSGIALGANRVKSLRLVEVRRYLSNGTMRVDNAGYTVHQLAAF